MIVFSIELFGHNLLKVFLAVMSLDSAVVRALVSVEAIHQALSLQA